MSRGHQLYIAWQNSCNALLDDWDQLPESVQEDWQTFADNLVIDCGLQLE